MAKKPTSKNKRLPTRRSNSGLKNPLVFIDTNILLDFYRARNEQGLALLQRLDSIRDRTITTDQVEMEFKKNRQRAIIETLTDLKLKDKIQAPAYLSRHKTVEAARKDLARAEERISRLKQTLQRALLNPTSNDPVYQVAQRIISKNNRCSLNLSRDNERLYPIRRLAYRRWLLGYPPRKRNDTSIGDAINWEWIIECAAPDKRDVVIVSRDSDYGVLIGKDAYINDWLLQEFRGRVSKQGQVRLTPRLSEGLGFLQERVSEEEKKGEEQLLERVEKDALERAQFATEAFKRLFMKWRAIEAEVQREDQEEEGMEGT